MITKDNDTINVGSSDWFNDEGNPIYIHFIKGLQDDSVWLTPQEALALAEELTAIAHKAAKDMETK